MSLNGKYSSGKASEFDMSKPFKNFQLGVVKTVGKVQVSTDDEGAANRDRRFNSDTHAIRVRLIGAKYDNKISDDKLANCMPLLPRHVNLVPKEGEVVMVMVFGEDEKYGDRWYMGPLISSDDKLNKDTIDGTAMSNLANGITESAQELSKIPLARGVYEDPQNLVIEGRDNSDIIQRKGEILLRAGKFVLNDPLQFNSKNPAYIKIKTNVAVNNEEEQRSDILSVQNLVADKINLLTYGTPNSTGGTYNLTTVNKETGVAEYITDEEMDRIINSAHPVVFGDTLVEYLKLFRIALISHVHNGSGNPATDRTDKGSLSLKNFLDKAESLEKDMLSKNIRIN